MSANFKVMSVELEFEKGGFQFFLKANIYVFLSKSLIETYTLLCSLTTMLIGIANNKLIKA